MICTRNGTGKISSPRINVGGGIIFSDRMIAAALALMRGCLARQIKLVFAESCTGGLISAAMTDIPGSSQIVERGFVVYSNEAKHELLGVPLELIEQHGAVSETVAIAMAVGAIQAANGRAQISISATGIAGPGSPTSKPEGLVHIAVAAVDRGVLAHRRCEFGAIGRTQVREATVLAALELAWTSLGLQ